ncbi:alpha/beta fold hydrolase [Oscillatoria sp. CS-180]|uniref:alpha/beta fold hydrolase n=1 Tax=Oscillatoria sp. CS-180 TaxID=3021720 RepID=UPI00232D5B28|nr:alpha/beta fold hydrolase [Oscillatoria sp. CS-180]MDB9525999.1 alpha/beta fold hydrolase [Oscillatoria sp. CS-180]
MTAQLTAPNALEKQVWMWRGYRICHVVQGTGQPLVLIHGFGASIGHWRKNIPVLAAAGYQVHAIDLLGFGESDKPGIDYAIETWESLLQDYWREHIGHPAVFVGNSIGGLITLMMLAHSPEMAQAGVLLNCAGGLSHRPEEFNLPLRFMMGTFTKLVSSNLLGPLVFNEVRRKFRIRGSLKQVYHNPTAVTDELVELLYRPSCDPGAQKVFASIVSAPPGPRPIELLPHIKQPLLVLWGERDPWTPIEGATIYRELSETPDVDPPVTFHSIPDTGHCPHDEQPEVVNQLIQDWLQTL